MNANTQSRSDTRIPAKTAFVQGEPARAETARSQAPVPAAVAAQADRRALDAPAFIEPERRRNMIAEAAYYRAERRGFEPGCDLEDWLLAESEIDGMLTRSEIAAVCDVAGLT